MTPSSSRTPRGKGDLVAAPVATAIEAVAAWAAGYSSEVERKESRST